MKSGIGTPPIPGLAKMAGIPRFGIPGLQTLVTTSLHYMTEYLLQTLLHTLRIFIKNNQIQKYQHVNAIPRLLDKNNLPDIIVGYQMSQA